MYMYRFFKSAKDHELQAYMLLSSTLQKLATKRFQRIIKWSKNQFTDPPNQLLSTNFSLYRHKEKYLTF